jgi:hypothetical protein
LVSCFRFQKYTHFHVHELYFALIAVGITIVSQYFVWKSKYFFVYSLLSLWHITARLVLLSSVFKHVTCSEFIIETSSNICLTYEPRHDKTNKMCLWLSWIQTRLRICADWSRSMFPIHFSTCNMVCKWTAWILIRLRGCAGWSVSMLGANTLFVLSWHGSYIKLPKIWISET